MIETSERAAVRPARLAFPAAHSFLGLGLDVPDLEAARDFYTAFGLDVVAGRDALLLRGARADPAAPAAATLREGARRLTHLTFGAYEEDIARFKAQLEAAGIKRIDAPAGVEPLAGSIWVRDPDGTPVQIAPAQKTTPDHRRASLAYAPGDWRHAPPRAGTQANPFRLGHTFLFTASIEQSTRFYSQALGLGQSDGNDYVAFLHGRHGSDHHILGFGQSHAPGFHHFSFEVENIDQIGVGGQHMAARGSGGWGFGRHVAGSNYFWYVRDPFGGWAEYFCDIDYIPAGTEVPHRDLAPEDSVYLWGPPMPEDFIVNPDPA
jgi:catechol 2,3-dioxygenase-like lactoylglutathione lyase family enzyme